MVKGANRTVAADVDRDLCELAGPHARGLAPSRRWADLAAVAAAIAVEQDLDPGELSLAAFRAGSPREGAAALLDAVWDQAVVLPDAGPE